MDLTKIAAGLVSLAAVGAIGVEGKTLMTTDTKTLTVVSGKAEDVSAAKIGQIAATVRDIPCWTEYVQTEKAEKVKLWQCMTDTGPVTVDDAEQKHLNDIGGPDATAILKKARQDGTTVVYNSEITRGVQPEPKADPEAKPAEAAPVEAEKNLNSIPVKK